jgi:anthranilate/para-aminobenzoate synthase component I
MPVSAQSPPSLRTINLELSPLEVASRLRALPGFFFLDTGYVPPGSMEPGAISIIGALPGEILAGNIRQDPAPLGDALLENDHGLEADWGVPLGGLFGLIEFDGSYHFGRYGNLLIFRHDCGQWLEVGDLLRCLAEAPASSPLSAGVDFSGQMGRAEFCAMVERAKDYIAAGDIYQVNLSHRFDSLWPEGADAFDFYLRLRDCSPAPYAAFFDTGCRQVISSSPECFLNLSGGRIVTRPIKGTRPRYYNAGEDERSAYELMTSPKEIAELIMITDLERNDIGKVCEFGSVRVAELLKLERFAQVFHLVSTVEGRLRPEFGHLQALHACFPGGSISGAPKHRALEIIAELEPVSRGLYTGAIGYLGANGESQFSIAIRTAIIEDGMLSLHAGAGIVADSQADSEYEETLHKAAGFFAAAREF